MQFATTSFRRHLALLALCLAVGGAHAAPGPGFGGGDFVGRELFRFEHLADELELDDTQRAAFEKLTSQARADARPLVRRLVEQHRAMRALTEAEVFDEAAVRAQAQSGSATMVDLAVLHARNLHALRALLTPEQRDALETLRPYRHRRP
ncbi:MAG: Spy/CpxP family protein refolding chaperone [Gammaproteobacteria bacterium]